MKTKPFSELRNRMTPDQRAESETRAKIMSLHIALIDLQESLGLTKDDLDRKLGDIESIVSDVDNQEDFQVSTLSRYIKALGGNLKIVADFPQKQIVLAQFE